ncbi:MAG: laccase, partial [Leptolyngbya sp. RL_3_1]|nr:laccase [Leptolyngbya sp. RL_3_1]
MGLSSSEFISPPDPQDLLWQWERSGDRSYLVCGLLEQFTHGFFTKEWEGHKPKDLTQLWGQALKTYNLTQIHGKLVWTTAEIDRDHIGEGDGLISDRGGDCLWVASADCNPILIGDITTGRVSAVHAGWRGTAQK